MKEKPVRVRIRQVVLMLIQTALATTALAATALELWVRGPWCDCGIVGTK